MSHINSYFDNIYCVNLNTRPDKWEICKTEFSKHNMRVERFNAINGRSLKKRGNISHGEAGCSLSHASIFETFSNSTMERVLILEDDVEFVPDFEAVFQSKIAQVPEWDILYFGGTHMTKPSQVNEHFSRAIKTYTTSHYAITKKVVPLVLEEIKRLERQVDVILAEKQPQLRAYVFDPAVAWQRPSFSDIHNVHVDYTGWMKPK